MLIRNSQNKVKTSKKFGSLDKWFHRSKGRVGSSFPTTLHYLYWWVTTEGILAKLRMFDDECPQCGNTLDRARDNLSPVTFIGQEANDALMSYIHAGIDPTDSPEFRYLDDVIRDAGIVSDDYIARKVRAFIKLWDRCDLWVGRQDEYLSFDETCTRLKLEPGQFKHMLAKTSRLDCVCHLPSEKSGFNNVIINFRELLRVFNLFYRARKYRKELEEINKLLCYRDMTFCTFYKECAVGNKCYSALTDKVKYGSEKSGLPIAQFMEKPPCFIDRDGTKSECSEPVHKETQDETDK